MNEQKVPIYDEETETEEQKEEKSRLKAIFAEIESKQVEFLDEAGKSINGASACERFAPHFRRLAAR